MNRPNGICNRIVSNYGDDDVDEYNDDDDDDDNGDGDGDDDDDEHLPPGTLVFTTDIHGKLLKGSHNVSHMTN